MSLFKRKNKVDKNLTLLIDHVEGLQFFDQEERLNVTWNKNDKELIFESLMNKKKPVVKLNLKKIIYVDVATEKEIIEKDKTVIGRAAVGTLLAGPLGAVIGGMSGIGSKKKSKDRKIAVIGYDGGEILLMGSGFSIGMDHFFKLLNNDIVTSSAKDGTIEL